MPMQKSRSRTKPLWIALTLLLLTTLLLVACGETATQTQSTPTPTATTAAPVATDTPTPVATATTAATTAPTQSVQIKIVEANGRYAFQPATITVPKGAQITWTNESDAPHTVTSDTSAFTTSNTLSQNATFKMAFPTAGTYAYHCAIHPYMTATVTVTA